MATETMTQARTVQATLNWTPREGGCDALTVDLSNLDDHKWDTRTAEIEDIRGRESDCSLDKQGFEFHHDPVSFKAFDDEEAITKEYYREVERLALKVYARAPNAPHAVSHVKRISKTAEGTTPTGQGPPASNLHVDFSYDGGWQRYSPAPARKGQVSNEDWANLTRHRRAVLSIWRPIHRKVTRDALCVGDYRTVREDHYLPTMPHHPDGTKAEFFNVMFHPGQKYCFQSEMGPEETIVLKLFEANAPEGVARCTPHSGFRGEGDYGEARNSIEVRCLVCWEE